MRPSFIKNLLITMLISFGFIGVAVTSFAVETSDLLGVWVSQEANIKIKIDSDNKIFIKELSTSKKGTGKYTLKGDQLKITSDESSSINVSLTLKIVDNDEKQIHVKIVQYLQDDQPVDTDLEEAIFKKVTK